MSDFVTTGRRDHRSTRADAPQHSVLDRGVAMSRNRTIVLCCILALMAAMAGGAWVAGERIVSPAEAAARTAPPTPSPILVPIEKRVLSSQIVTRGTARFGTPQPVALAPSSLKLNTAGLITTLPQPNTQIQGRRCRVYGLGPPRVGSSGRHSGLSRHGPRGRREPMLSSSKKQSKRLGFDPGDVDGSYDEKTERSRRRMVQSKGHEAFGPTATQLAQLACCSKPASARRSRPKWPPLVQRPRPIWPWKTLARKSPLATKWQRAEISAKIADRALVALDPRQTGLARTAADEKLDTARSGLASAKLEGEMAVKTASGSETCG